uniref:NUC153 domain-containing protein n=1 Tax=Peronospora matthiolae TaxID=2874970 RepID=A0AAV1UQJ6_9STRA
MSDPVRDQRFQKVHNDPRFARNSKRKNKLQVDRRFAGALTNERFQSVQGKYDKYGRRIEKRDNEMKEFYCLEEEEVEGEEEEKEGEMQKNDSDTEDDEEKVLSTMSSDDDSGEAEVAAVESGGKLSRLTYLNRMARGELGSGSDSSDSDDSSDDEVEDVVEEEAEDIPMGEETRRFAVLNCDWTRIRAVDLFALCQSFAPATGAVENVTIYPSDYGLQKTKEEEQHGPQGLWNDGVKNETNDGEQEDDEKSDEGGEQDDENTSAGDGEKTFDSRDEDDICSEDGEKDYDSDDPLGVKKSVTLEDESDGFDREKLRKYELQKLRYYYAIVTCDSVKTASTIFDQCDQLEYETSSNVLDLRYVPDDMTFSNTPKELCDGVPDRYKPAIFATLALQQTDVKLTWEEDDDQRLELLTRPADWKDADDDDFKAYLASDVSDASEVEADSEDSDEEKETEGKTDVGDLDSKKKSKKEVKIKKLRNRYRSMLLGSDAEDDDNSDVVRGSVGGSTDDDDGARDEGDMELSFTPGASEVLKSKRQKELEANETPFERYTREKKLEKNRKLHEKRARQKMLEREQREVLKKKGRGAKEVNLLREAINGGGGNSDAGNSHSDEDERNFNMKLIAKQEKVKSLKGKRRVKEMKKLVKKKASGEMQESFEFDAADPRFGALYAKGSQFQLDPTDPKYKKTEATQAIFKERRQRYDTDAVEAKPTDFDVNTASTDSGKHALNAMVENLKRKSQQQLRKEAKKQKKKLATAGDRS